MAIFTFYILYNIIIKIIFTILLLLLLFTRVLKNIWTLKPPLKIYEIKQHFKKLNQY